MEKAESNCEWFCAPGAYQNLVRELCDNDPRLKEQELNGFLDQIPWLHSGQRVVKLKLHSNNSFSRIWDFTRLDDISRGLSESFERQQAVLLVQGLTPELIGMLGEAFGIHPSVFMDHLKVSWTLDRNTLFLDQKRDDIALPSAAKSKSSYTIRYTEPLALSTPPVVMSLRCTASGRRLCITRNSTSYSNVVLTRRKLTVFSKRIDVEGWICVFFCDPPPKKCRATLDWDKVFEVESHPYHRGYTDFMPHVAQVRVKKGPPRTAMLDDLAFYLETYGQELYEMENADRSDPDHPSVFAKKIVVAHYMETFEFYRSIICASHAAFTRAPHPDINHIEAMERAWRDVQTADWRSSEFRDDLWDALNQFAISETDSTSPSSNGWADWQSDFRFLFARSKAMIQSTGSLSTSTMGLAGLIGNRQSYQENRVAVQHAEQSLSASRSMKALTLAGIVFIPLTYTSSLFSMTGNFTPGARKFWMYFVVALPLMLAVVLGYFILDSGYNGNVTWSGRVLLRSLRRRKSKERIYIYDV